MRLFVGWALLVGLIALPAAAEPPDQSFAIKLSKSEVNAVVQALTQCPIPWSQSNPLLQTIVGQFQEQQKPALAAEEPKK